MIVDNDQHPGQRHHTGAAPTEARPRRRPGRQTPSATRQRNLELLDRALDLFLQRGFERTSIDAIAASVGMAKRTVYLRYGDKTGLFKAALKRAIESWIVPVERLRAAESDDVEQTFLRIGQILVANVINPAGMRLYHITNAESGRLPEIGAFSYTQGTAPTVAYLADFIRRCVRVNGAQVSDPEEAAMAFLFLVVGGPASSTAWGVVLSETEIENYTRNAVQLFLHGLLNTRQGVGGAQGRPVSLPLAHEQPAKSEGHDAATPIASDRTALEEENRRLKLLLADSMLEIAALREKARSG